MPTAAGGDSPGNTTIDAKIESDLKNIPQLVAHSVVSKAFPQQVRYLQLVVEAFPQQVRYLQLVIEAFPQQLRYLQLVVEAFPQ